MRQCQEVLSRLGVHGTSLTTTVSRIAEVLPVEHTHVKPSALVPDTSVSTDLAIHPSLPSACDTATYDFVGHSAAKTAFTLPHWI